MAGQSWATSEAVRRSMQANRSRDTAPELALRKALHRMGLRYRVCARPLRGVRRTVDIAFGPARVAVEVRGCFWHGCPEHYRAPAANGQFWAAKVARNMARDVETTRQLTEAGWVLLVVWEHDILQRGAIETCAAQIAQVVRDRRAASTSKGPRVSTDALQAHAAITRAL